MNDPASTIHPSPLPVQGKPERNWMPWIAALIAVAFLAALAWLIGSSGRQATHSAGVDPYASKLILRGVHLSQASNFAGDQLTYVDGTVENTGDRTVTAITVRVLFPNDLGEQPQTEELPLNLIRAREPYVDIEPVSVEPLKPGTSQEFRLIFDKISSSWNQQVPRIQVVHVRIRS